MTIDSPVLIRWTWLGLLRAVVRLVKWVFKGPTSPLSQVGRECTRVQVRDTILKHATVSTETGADIFLGRASATER